LQLSTLWKVSFNEKTLLVHWLNVVKCSQNQNETGNYRNIETGNYRVEKVDD